MEEDMIVLRVTGIPRIYDAKTPDGHPSHRYYHLNNVLFPIREAIGIGYGEPERDSQSIRSLPTWRADTYCLGLDGLLH